MLGFVMGCMPFRQ